MTALNKRFYIIRPMYLIYDWVRRYLGQKQMIEQTSTPVDIHTENTIITESQNNFIDKLRKLPPIKYDEINFYDSTTSCAENDLDYQSSSSIFTVPTTITKSAQAPASTKKKKRKRIYRCKVTNCNLIFQRRDVYQRHEFTHTNIRKFSCPKPLCDKTYTNNSHLRRHIRNSHATALTAATMVRQIKCKASDCTRLYTNWTTMMQHYRAEHNRIIKCSICSEQFPRKEHLKRHMFEHTGNYPHQCIICSKGFLSQKLLRNHSVTHKQHKCLDCDLMFDKWSDLLTHRRQIKHKKLYKCLKCDKEFKSKANRKIHMNTHLDPSERRVFECIDCNKFYVLKRNLKTHILRHHRHRVGTVQLQQQQKDAEDGQQTVDMELPSIDDRFICSYPECNQRKFSTKQKLNYHLSLHASNKIVNGKSIRIYKPSGPRRRRKDAGTKKLNKTVKVTVLKLCNISKNNDSDLNTVESSAIVNGLNECNESESDFDSRIQAVQPQLER